MSDLITLQGVVLSAMPVGEFDKRLVLLTRQRGKITVFAKGARRPKSPFMAVANPFVFGNFTLYEGRSSYNLNQAEATHHFVELAAEQPGIYYGFYFLELADYYGRENVDEKEMMNLLYVSLRALLNPNIDNELVRYVFEFRTLVIQGEYPEIFQCAVCGEGEGLEYFSLQTEGVLCSQCRKQVKDTQKIETSALYALQYIAGAPLNRLYTFKVSPQVLHQLKNFVSAFLRHHTDREFKSLEILKLMCRPT